MLLKKNQGLWIKIPVLHKTDEGQQDTTRRMIPRTLCISVHTEGLSQDGQLQAWSKTQGPVTQPLPHPSAGGQLASPGNSNTLHNFD